MATICYQCEQTALELNKNSRCILCVTKSNEFNQAEQDKLWEELFRLRKALSSLPLSVQEEIGYVVEERE